MRFALVVIALVAACGERAGDADARALAAMDLAQASREIRTMAGDCAGFARALARTSRSTRHGIRGRALAGLVADAVDAARPHCPDALHAIDGDGDAEQLARARLLDDKPDLALAALDADASEPAIRWRRADLLDRLGRPRDALAELDAAAADSDADAKVQHWLLAVAIAAREGPPTRTAHLVSEANVPDRPRLAHRAAGDAPRDQLAALATAAVEPELATAVGDRLEAESGAAAALAARRRAVELAPSRAEHHDALARALAAAHRWDEAIVTWDHAADLAPAQPAYQLAPIRAALAGGDPKRARERAVALADRARGKFDVDMLVTASSAASIAGDTALAVALAREAHERRPQDGRITFAVADRLAELGDLAGAIDHYATLLICGAHGKPWHRHEVAGKLRALATDDASKKLVTAALAASHNCKPADPDDLAKYR